ncbi:MAG TPA: HAMP domain-containing sensor histidine kinase [Clostridia bacterium]|nr:HAMP domain-containing sensor histidine kinase [Clostridia bacterium]
MDTKLKKLSHSIIVKIILFALIVASFTLLVSGLLIDDQRTEHSIVSVLNSNSFYESQILNSKIYSDLHRIHERLELNEKLSLTKQKGYISDERILSQAKEDYNIESIEELNNLEENQITEIKRELIDQDVAEIKRNLSNSSEVMYLKYYLKSDSFELSNADDSMARAFSSSEIYMVKNQSSNIVAPEAFKEKAYYFNHTLKNIHEKTDIFYTSFPNNILEDLREDYTLTKSIAENRLRLSVIYLSVGVISLLLLMIIIGRNGEVEKVQMNFVDKLYTDINLLILSILVVTYIIIMSEFIQMGLNEIEYYLPLTIFAISLGLLLFLSIIKHLKNRTLIKHSLIYTILSKIFLSLQSIFNMGSLGIKIVLAIGLYTFLVLFSVLIYPLTILAIPVFFIILLWIINIKGIKKVKIGTQKIREGNLDHKIEVKRNGELKKIAGEINGIREGLKNALMNEVKSERLKTELITNVSHDLRTPLTSIITYIDLLKEEKDPEKQKKYINVLDQKSNRLKILTDDLFEMSKLKSGNIQTEKSKIDLVDLINQGLGEYENSIEESGLDFILSFSDDERFFVNADGSLIWRSIDNIFSNIFKYALENSRVYIDVTSKENYVILTVKNISRNALNICADELLQRFTRGDEARSNDGSGLGLSIAKSLVEVQNGSLDIVIDGDLFKVMIKLEKYKVSTEEVN